jgi:preprotein translocase subunit YajC
MKGAASYLILLLFLLPVLLIYSQRRRFKAQQRNLHGALSEGDEIMTRGGMFGTVRDVRDDTMDVEIAPDVVVRFHRQAVAQIIVDRPAPEVAALGVSSGADDATETTG